MAEICTDGNAEESGICNDDVENIDTEEISIICKEFGKDMLASCWEKAC